MFISDHDLRPVSMSAILDYKFQFHYDTSPANQDIYFIISRLVCINNILARMLISDLQLCSTSQMAIVDPELQAATWNSMY